ncbi:Carboxy-terminal processing protease CtpB precursor [Candidatus Izimaplasma bacterium HR1]|jgi:carboxyl-terminal processing protease|uniref:S41 family peptidase n=1 Tax=Candidatus Izimoplasma sp. HR1 TaxID=1541959 RepID=UPI0004F5D88D|nr:Carboxy-terminal processing protease CtpB precursor [Candidatus Izimaplasma bacterium HR1]
MQKRIVSIVAFILVVAASFYLGTFVNTPSGETNLVFDEVMNQLLDNHYTKPTEEELWQGAIDGILDSVDDPYTSYFDYDEFDTYRSSFGETYVGIGITVVFQDDRIVVEEVKAGGPADNAGILPNDIIIEVESEDITSMSFYEAISNIVGEEDTEVSIGLIRQGVENIITLTMSRTVIVNSTVTYTTYNVGTETIGYIYVSTFGDATAELFTAAVLDLEEAGIDGLVVDLRNNGGGHLGTVVSMLQEFLVNDGREMFSIEYYAEGVFKRDEFFGSLDAKKSYDIVTLVNGNSASASEVFASAMQEHGEYPVVGTTTFGKGTMQLDIKLQEDESDFIHLTIGKWLTADGNWVHFDGGTDGVIPDVIVEQSSTELAYKLFFAADESLGFDTVDHRTENLQVILNAMGYTVREDGYFDQETKDAIIDIQTNNSLTITGDVDSEVLVIINEFLTTYKNDYLNDSQLAASLNIFDE